VIINGEDEEDGRIADRAKITDLWVTGAVAVPVNARFTARELGYVVP